MTQILEAIGLALNSVWANKLRSFMMVLGNIVAVTSIIAVVSLIQGMNAYVSDAIIKDVGVGTFKVEKIGFITDEEEERRAWRRNPDVTTLDMKAIEDFSPVDSRGHGRSGRARERHVQGRAAREHAGAGRLGDLRRVQRLRRRSAAGCRAAWKSSAAGPVALLGWDTADKLFKGRNPSIR